MKMRAKIKENLTAMQFAKDISIYEVLINTKVAWEQLPSDTILNCFKSAGIHDFKSVDTPPSPPPPIEIAAIGSDDFNMYFFGRAYDDELETCSPPTAPDTGSYLGPETTKDESECEPDQDQDPTFQLMKMQ